MPEVSLIEGRAAGGHRNRTRRALIKSFGCQMNVYDSQRIADLVAAEGYAEATSPEDADLIILNTCHIREKASAKIFSELGKLRELKEERRANGRSTTLVVAGCVAQAAGEEVLRRQPSVDVVVGPQSYHRLRELLREAETRPGVVDTTFRLNDKFERLPPAAPEVSRARGVAAFVTVQEGCDKFCSFCVVPYTRGAEASRPVAAILDEIARLADAGVREVMLLGQNVNAYHGMGRRGDGATLADLIGLVAAISGVARIRYATSHPNDMREDLIAAHRDIPKLAPFLHLPVQSGSDRILKAMKRRHRASDYLETVGRIRAARPDIAISSDFIAGYPGETDADFEATLELVRAVGFASSFAFKYSLRLGTPAADAQNQVAEGAKAERLAALQGLLESQRQAFNRATVGKRCAVLFEKLGRHPGQIVGRSPYIQAVFAEGPETLIGKIGSVEILEAGPNSLRGRVV